MKYLPLVLITILMSRDVFAAPVHLSGDGAPQMAIVVAPNASAEVRSLAIELSQALKTITGAEFSIQAQDGEQGIVIGTSEEWPGHLPKPAEGLSPLLAREDYLLKSEPHRLLIIGRTPLAVQNAVWDLLYRIGFRQYLPGKKWEMWPADPNLAVDLDVAESPDYFTRRLRVGATTWPENRKAVEEWKRRNRMISGFSLSSGHVYGRIVSQNREFFDKNPGTYTGPQRDPKLDASQQAVLDIVGTYVLKEMEKDPNRDSISMEPSDGGDWPEHSRLGSPSNQAVTLANYAAQILRTNYPGRKVGIYAYNLHSPPPDINVEPDVIVGVATSFIKGGYTADFLMEKWHEKGAEIGVREYLGVAAWDFGLPGRARASDLDYIGRTLSQFHERGARYWDSEVSEAWGVYGLGYFLAARALWNTKEADNRDALADEFFARSFGNSASIMKQLFQKCLLKSGNPMLSEDLIGRMYRLLDEALMLDNPPEVTARIEDFVLYARYVELMFRYQNSEGTSKRSVFDELVKLVQGNFSSFMFDRWTIFREIPGRVFRVKKSEILAWMKDAMDAAKPLDTQSMRKIVADGIKNNPLLDFESVAFSKDLKPYRTSSPGKGKAAAILLRGVNNIYLFAEQENSQFEFIIEAGMVYDNRGAVDVRLFSDQHAILDEAVASVKIEPNKFSQRVKLSSPYKGVHRLEISDGSGGTKVQWPAGQRAVFPASAEESTTFYSDHAMVFFVPKGSKIVGGYTNNRAGKIVTNRGNTVFDFSDMKGPGYFSVEVPKGADNACWSIQGVQGRKLLLTTPPYLARSEDELLIPREAQHEVKK